MHPSPATDRHMPTAEATVRDNPMRPPADSPSTRAQAWRVFLSHHSPQGLIALLVIGCIWRAQLGGWGWLDGVIVVAVWAIFPFVEWGIHRFVLHFRPVRWGRLTIDFYLPQTHRRHHADPWNLYWTFVPRHVYAWVLVSMAIGLWLADGWRGPLLTCYLVFLLQGLHYEWVHYLAHITWRPSLVYYERRVLATIISATSACGGGCPVGSVIACWAQPPIRRMWPEATLEPIWESNTDRRRGDQVCCWGG